MNLLFLLGLFFLISGLMNCWKSFQGSAKSENCPVEKVLSSRKLLWDKLVELGWFWRSSELFWSLGMACPSNDIAVPSWYKNSSRIWWRRRWEMVWWLCLMFWKLMVRQRVEFDRSMIEVWRGMERFKTSKYLQTFEKLSTVQRHMWMSSNRVSEQCKISERNGDKYGSWIVC